MRTVLSRNDHVNVAIHEGRDQFLASNQQLVRDGVLTEAAASPLPHVGRETVVAERVNVARKYRGVLCGGHQMQGSLQRQYIDLGIQAARYVCPLDHRRNFLGR